MPSVDVIVYGEHAIVITAYLNVRAGQFLKLGLTQTLFKKSQDHHFKHFRKTITRVLHIACNSILSNCVFDKRNEHTSDSCTKQKEFLPKK